MKHYGLEIPEGSSIKNMTAPSGTSFPSSANSAEMFFRTDDLGMYFHNGTGWELIGGTTVATTITVDTFTGTGSPSNLDYTLTTAPNTEAELLVYVGGVYQEQSTYSVSGTTLTLTESPADGVGIEVVLLPTSISGSTITHSSQTAAGGSPAQTTFSVTYTLGNIFVYLNGVKLVETTDYTATDEATVVLTEGAAEGDILAFEVFTPFLVPTYELVNDLSPQLGGDLDMNGFKVTTDMTVQDTSGSAITELFVQSPSGSAFVSFVDSADVTRAQFGLVETTSDEMHIAALGGEMKLSTNTGQTIHILPGNSNTTAGGSVIITGGNHALTADADGGDITMTGGTTVGGSPYRAGTVTFNGGDASVPGSFPGDVNFAAGNASGSNNIAGGGSVITGGSGSNSGSGSAGGQLFLKSGTARAGNNSGGQLSLVGGEGFGSGTGGRLVILGGDAGTTGIGGEVAITGGDGGATSGNGGSITLTPGAQSVGTPGTIDIAGYNSATGGSIDLLEASANGSASIQLKAPDSITTSRVVTLPQNDPSDRDALLTDTSGVTYWGSNGGNKNLIVNGDFRVWQRNSEHISPSSNTIVADQWSQFHVTTGAYTIRRVTGEDPNNLKLGNFYYEFDVTTADASIAVGDYTVIIQPIEGHSFDQANFGETNAQDVTISFWTAHTLTGTHNVAIRNSAQDRSYVTEYTQAVANAWEFHTVTIPGDTTGTWIQGGNVGVSLMFSVMTGSTWETTKDTWAAGNFWGTSAGVNNMSSTANYVRLSNVQFEISSVATNFEIRTLAEEMSMCERYFEMSYDIESHPGDSVDPGGDLLYQTGLSTGQHSAGHAIVFKTRKREVPTIVMYSNVDGASNKIYDFVQAANVTPTVSWQGDSGFRWLAQGAVSKTLVNFTGHWTAESKLV